MWIGIVATGVAVGLFGGMFGKGGSAVATPLLAAIGVAPMAALASPLPATIPATVVAYRRFRADGFGDRAVMRTSIAFGIPATLLGSLATRWISGSMLVTVTEVVVAALGLRIVFRSHRSEDVEGAPCTGRVRVATVAVVVGVLAGLLANAGGFLLVPLYLAVLRLKIKDALACSLGVAAVLAVPGTAVHAVLGHIDWPVALVFGAASVPSSALGARLAIRLDATRLERIYGAGLAVIGLSLLVAR